MDFDAFMTHCATRHASVGDAAKATSTRDFGDTAEAARRVLPGKFVH